MDSKVLCSGYDYRRWPAVQYDATLGTARTNSREAIVTHKMSIERVGFKSEKCVSIALLSQ